MTSQILQTINDLAAQAKPINDEDWGSERQIDAENSFFDFIRLEIGVDLDELDDNKSTCTELIDAGVVAATNLVENTR